MQGGKHLCIWILLCAAIQFDQHHLLKMLSFLPKCVSGFKKKNQVSIGVWTCLSMIPFISMSAFMANNAVFISIVL